MRSTIEKMGSISVLNLKGNSYFEIGVAYGRLLKNELHLALKILLSSRKNNTSEDDLVNLAERFHSKYSYMFKHFIDGIAQGCGLEPKYCKILNGMETLKPLLDDGATDQCAFWSIPPNKTATNSVIVGRNYDYQKPFNKIAQMLAVTVIHKTDTIPTAIIGMPGQIYCPSCVNANGVFLELNSGKALKSAKWSHVNNNERHSLLIRLLEIIQSSPDLDEVTKQLRSTQSDTTLIINTANKTATRSFEFSSTLGMKPFFPKSNAPFVSTNFFLNTSWAEISATIAVPESDSDVIWESVTRRDHLLNLLGQNKTYTINDAKSIANHSTWAGYTIYQIIYDSSSLTIHVKPVSQPWVEIPLNPYFLPSWKDQIHSQITYVAEKGWPSFSIGFISGFADAILSDVANGKGKYISKLATAATMYLLDHSFAGILVFMGFQTLLQKLGFSERQSQLTSWTVVMALNLFSDNPALMVADTIIGVLANLIGFKSGNYLGNKITLFKPAIKSQPVDQQYHEEKQLKKFN